MSQHITFRCDDDVPVVQLLRGLTAVGLTLSNTPGTELQFRVHRAESMAAVVDLAARRRGDGADQAGS